MIINLISDCNTTSSGQRLRRETPLASPIPTASLARYEEGEGRKVASDAKKISSYVQQFSSNRGKFGSRRNGRPLLFQYLQQGHCDIDSIVFVVKNVDENYVAGYNHVSVKGIVKAQRARRINVATVSLLPLRFSLADIAFSFNVMHEVLGIVREPNLAYLDCAVLICL
ncbi:unnamed protein product, partial [Mesorhabditis spiculigera]